MGVDVSKNPEPPSSSEPSLTSLRFSSVSSALKYWVYSILAIQHVLGLSG